MGTTYVSAAAATVRTRLKTAANAHGGILGRPFTMFIII